MPQAEQQPRTSRFSSLMNIQYIWFLGHLTTTVCFILYIFTPLYAPLISFYKKSFLGVLISYGIVLYKLYGLPKFNKMYWIRLTNDENFQYMLLSMIWMTSPPLFFLLMPYGLFSFFHALQYMISNIFPVFVPNPSEKQKSMISSVQRFINVYQPAAIQANAKLEVLVILPALIVFIFLKRASIMEPFIYSQFLRFRYISSAMIQKEFANLRAAFDSKLLGNTKVPGVIQNAYVKVRDFMIKLGTDPNIAAAQQQQQADNKQE